VKKDTLTEYFPLAVTEAFNEFKNWNFLLKRFFKYETDGRYQTEEQAIQVDMLVESMLQENSIEYTEIESSWLSINLITAMILEEISDQKLNTYLNECVIAA
jgi:hypothetical protein